MVEDAAHLSAKAAHSSTTHANGNRIQAYKLYAWQEPLACVSMRDVDKSSLGLRVLMLALVGV